MKKIGIGIIYSKGIAKDERIFLKQAKKKGIDLIMIDVFKEMSEELLEKKIKKCRIIYNSSAEDFALEYARSIKELGKTVIDSPEEYYNTEDKWMFFLKCKTHKIPTPETILLCEDINIAKRELKKFKKWPVILKRVYGTMGEFVKKADNLPQAVKIIKGFWEKGNERIPIIAQELIPSPSYRVTLIGNKIVQTALKENNGWKSTGVYAKKFKKFKVDKKLKKIIKKLERIIKIKICGIDFLKDNEEWKVLEVNSEPAFDFFENERKKLIGLTLDYLKKIAKNKK